MIQGIFYARFLPQEGTKIVAQSPPGCIVATTYTPHLKPPLVDFDIVQEYIIPRKAFFNRFVTANTPDGKHTILGFPVSIPHERYHRNEFIFNFGLVVESDVDPIPYERLIRRLAVTFAEMERQTGYLSSEGHDCCTTLSEDMANDGRRPIESLLEIVKEDLNNYGECMIPVDEANTLNMKLFPYHPPPPAVRGWHVPVPKMKLADMVDPTWDLTLQKIIPHVDGVNDVRRIAWLADVSLPLTQCALRHLLYYDTVLLLDIFFFGSCYAPRPGIHDFIANRDDMIDECMNYVCVNRPGTAGSSTAASGGGGGEGSGDAGRGAPGKSGGGPGDAGSTSSENTAKPDRGGGHRSSSSVAEGLQPPSRASTPVPPPPNPPPTSVAAYSLDANHRLTHYQLIKLMTTFCVGRSVMEWIKLHQDAGFDVLRYVDVRRLVQFGVIKGLLYRVHKYVVSKQYLTLLATGRRQRERGERDRDRDRDRENKGRRQQGQQQPSSSSSLAVPGRRGGGGGGRDAGRRDTERWGGGGGGGGGGDHDAKGKGETETNTGAVAGSKGNVGDGDELLRYIDGCHCFDQIITEQNLTDAEIMQKLRSFQPGDLTVFYR